MNFFKTKAKSQLTLGITNFRKPILTFHALNTFYEQNSSSLSGVDLIIIDNSLPKRALSHCRCEMCISLRNKKDDFQDNSEKFFEEHEIPFYSGRELDIHWWYDDNEPRTCHGHAARKIIDLCQTKHLLLIDSDVEFKRPIKDTLEGHIMEKAVASGYLDDKKNVSGGPGGNFIVQYPNCNTGNYNAQTRTIHERIAPWYMFIDIEQWRQNDMYFNGDMIWPEGGIDPNIREDVERMYDNMTPPVVFDAGAFALFQLQKKELVHLLWGGNMNDNEHYRHFIAESRLDKGNTVVRELEERYADGESQRIYKKIRDKGFYRHEKQKSKEKNT